MKIVFFTEYDAGGSWAITEPLVRALRERDHQVDLFAVDKGERIKDFDKSLKDYDIAHFVNSASLVPFNFGKDIWIPFTLTIHHLPYGHEPWYEKMIKLAKPEAIVVMDHFAQRQLAQRDIFNTRYIRQCIDVEKWKPLPYPKEFTLGYLGAEPEYKRYHIIKDIATAMEVPCVGHISNQTWISDEAVMDLYRNMSCFVVAGFNDGGPLPPQEALLCGRPVLTTYVGMMPEIVLSGFNGEFFDGSVLDGARQAMEIKSNFEWYSLNTLEDSSLPDPDEIAVEYEDFFKEVLK